MMLSIIEHLFPHGVICFLCNLALLSFGICLLLRDHVLPCTASVILTLKRPFWSRHDAVAPFAVLGDDAAAVVVRFARDDARSAAVPVQPMYRFCIEATLPNDSGVIKAADEHVTSVDFQQANGIANTGCNDVSFVILSHSD